MDEVVYKANINGITCQFIKRETGYLRQQIFPNGVTFESDYSEEDYQDFLEAVVLFNEAQKKSKAAK